MFIKDAWQRDESLGNYEHRGQNQKQLARPDGWIAAKAVPVDSLLLIRPSYLKDEYAYQRHQ
jgi:hypothetical protein